MGVLLPGRFSAILGPVPGAEGGVGRIAPVTRTEAILSVPVPLHIYSEEPSSPGDGPFPAVVGLHGYAMSAPPLLGLMRRFVPKPFLTISLEGPFSAISRGEDLGSVKQTGYHWGASPRHEESRAVHRDSVKAAVEWAVSRGADPGRIVLLGFSQPCALNYRLALDPPHGRPFASVVALCGGVPGDWTADDAGAGTPASLATPVLHLSTRQDPYYPLEKVAAFRPRLLPRFASVEHVLVDGGHRVPSESFEALTSFLSR
jgi:predicted esterase